MVFVNELAGCVGFVGLRIIENKKIFDIDFRTKIFFFLLIFLLITEIWTFGIR